MPKLSKKMALAAQEERKKKALNHKDVLGEGAKKRKHLKGQEKIGVVMSEFKRGTLHSGSGKKVTSRKMAIAIAMSEAGMSKKKKGK
jgi:hypothetical protein